MAKAKKLPSGSWRVREYIGEKDGKKIYKSFTALTKKEAEALGAQYVISHHVEEAAGMTLKEAMEKYNEVKKGVLSPSTLKGYESLKNIGYKEIENYPLESLDNVMIAEWVTAHSKDSPKTLRNKVGYLTTVLALYAPEKRLKFKLPQKKKVKYHVVTDEEMRVLLAATKDTKLGVAIRLATFTPARRSEVCALDYSDIKGNQVDYNKAMVQDKSEEWIIKPPKTEAGYRIVSMPNEIIKEIGTGERRIIDCYNPNTLYKAFKRKIKELGLPDFRFHDLRHYGATFLHAQGVPDKYIMQRGGWSNMATLQQIYTHCLPDKVDDVDRIVSEKFKALNG